MIVLSSKSGRRHFGVLKSLKSDEEILVSDSAILPSPLRQDKARCQP